KQSMLQPLFTKDEAGNYIRPIDYILGEIKNFLVASHDTTGNVISWTLYLLAKHPYVLRQVTQEIDQVLQSKLPDFDSIEELPFLDMVIQETLRLYPPIWVFTRKAIADDQVNDYFIPGGAFINISPYLIHRHPKYWNQPTIFYPERFLKE